MCLPHTPHFICRGRRALQKGFKRIDLRARKGLSEEWKDNLFGYALLLPTFAVFALVVLFPIFKAMVMSFCEYTYVTVKKGSSVWNHFANYKYIFDNGFLYQLSRTLLFTLGTVGIELILGMAIALLLNTNIRGRNIYRSLFLMSWTIPSIVTALLWKWLFNAQYGLVNFFGSSLGLLSNPNQLWLLDPKRAMATVIIAVVWRQTPYMLVMILAGLQSINHDLIEAAVIDGANVFQTFFRVMLPCIKTVLGNTLITCIMASFQQFTIIYNMTGPLKQTMTMSIATYQMAFKEFNLGAGAAVGVIWMLVLGTGISIYNNATKRFDFE